MEEQQITTLKDVTGWVQHWNHTCNLNHIDPSKVEFFIQTNRKNYRPFADFFSIGTHGVFAGIEFFESDVIRFDPKDSRPPGGEYWKSRGASSFDVSGFIVSKQAGERLLRMVKYLLETDEPHTRLDWREFEPNWIQFKFSAEEFDVVKLDEMARANNDVLTEDIVRKCIKPRGNSER